MEKIYKFLNYTDTQPALDRIDDFFIVLLIIVLLIGLLIRCYYWRFGNCKAGKHNWTRILLGAKSNYCKVCGKRKEAR